MARRLSVLSHNRLKEILHYNPVTGVFTWKERIARKVRVGDKAGTHAHGGYILIIAFRKRYYAHRLAWFYMTGEWPPSHVDHANLMPGDNRWRNLRAATQSTNMANASRRCTNRSGFKGVHFDAAKSKWQATLTHDYKRHFLGRYDDKIEAAKAYDRGAKKHFGEFARLNFPAPAA